MGYNAIVKCCNSIASTIPLVVRNALQKCNMKIWNALAKVQSHDMDLFPEWAPSIEYNGSIVPMWTEKILSRSVLAEGECEFWDHLCPGIAPNPLLLLLGFLSGLFLVGLFVLFAGGFAAYAYCIACI